MQTVRRLGVVFVAMAVALGLAPPKAAAATGWLVGTRGRTIALLDAAGRARGFDGALASKDDIRRVSPVWDPTGRYIAFGQTRSIAFQQVTSEIRTLDVETMRVKSVVKLPLAGFVDDVAWSPDGRRFAFVLVVPNWVTALATWSAVGSHSELFVVDIDGKHLRPVVSAHTNFVSNPVWSPDGRSLAYESDGSLVGVHTVSVQPLGVPRLVSPPGTAAGNPVWSPDGQRIAFIGGPVESAAIGGPKHLWVVGRLGYSAQPIAFDVWGYRPSWSPDSRSVVVASSDGLLQATLRGRVHRLTMRPYTDPAWSRSGTIAALGTCVRNACERGVFTLRPGEQPRQLGWEWDVSGPLAWSP